MSKVDVVRSWTEKLLAELTGEEPDELITDSDGDWPMRHASMGYWVSVAPHPEPHIRVWSQVVNDVPLSAGLLEELNDWNATLSHLHAWWRDGMVWLAGELVGVSTELGDLRCLTDEIALQGHAVGPGLARRHGGEVRFPEAVDDEALDDDDEECA